MWRSLKVSSYTTMYVDLREQSMHLIHLSRSTLPFGNIANGTAVAAGFALFSFSATSSFASRRSQDSSPGDSTGTIRDDEDRCFSFLFPTRTDSTGRTCCPGA